MRLNYLPLEIITLASLSFLWNEFAYYYFQFYLQNGFKWPNSETSDVTDYQSFTRIMAIADTHIMGPRRSYLIDKYIREWQMQKAFQISNAIYKPDIIIFLGDIFDEASVSSGHIFEEATKDFDRIFSIDKAKQKRIIIPGNHDVGFHNYMKRVPYALNRFEEKYGATPNIEMAKFNDLNIVSSNSMSFYNDSCAFCSEAIMATNQIARFIATEFQYRHAEFSRPILLTHIPLYRDNDSNCEYPNSMKERVKLKNVEGKDVIHEDASKFLLKRLNPRLVLSGHSHMNCKIRHNRIVEEITVTSFNQKYAEGIPGFLLVNANRTHLYTKKCDLLDARLVFTIYTAILAMILFRIFQHSWNNKDTSRILKNGTLIVKKS